MFSIELYNRITMVRKQSGGNPLTTAYKYVTGLFTSKKNDSVPAPTGPSPNPNGPAAPNPNGPAAPSNGPAAPSNGPAAPSPTPSPAKGGNSYNIFNGGKKGKKRGTRGKPKKKRRKSCKCNSW